MWSGLFKMCVNSLSSASSIISATDGSIVGSVQSSMHSTANERVEALPRVGNVGDRGISVLI